MQPMRIIDIGRHKELVLYACTHNDRIHISKEVANTTPIPMTVQCEHIRLQQQQQQQQQQ